MKTSLFQAHQALGAKIVDFCGWQMPLQYKGIVHEHQAVRQRVGLFDVSHMGRIEIDGLGAEALLDLLSTNQIAGKEDGTATYTVWCDEKGMSIDDLIVYRRSKTRFFVVVNACNRQKDLDHLLHYSITRDVIINPMYEDGGVLALQGPDALPLIAELFPEAADLKPMHFLTAEWKGNEVVVSHTGYTGAGGVELYTDQATIASLWDELLVKGKRYGIEPIGLGARDTLRLEMGYALYGHELSPAISPVESVSAWTIKWDKPDFIGKKSLEALRTAKKRRWQYGIVLDGEGIAREGYPVIADDHPIGLVTSGTFSPTLERSIAIVMVEKNLQVGESVFIKIRDRLCPAHVVHFPFIGTIRR